MNEWKGVVRMATESAVPAIRRVELSDDRWVELRTKRLTADARYQREQRHKRGGYDDDVLDELSLVEARVMAWTLTEKVPADMELRRQILDALEEDDMLKLILANKGVEENPKDSPAPSDDSSTGTSRSPRKAKSQKPSASGAENDQPNG